MQEFNSFTHLLETDDVDVQISISNDSFIKCLDKCAPIVTKEVTRSSTPSFNNDVSLVIQKRNDLPSKLIKDRDNLYLQQQYDKEKKIAKSEIPAAKKGTLFKKS